MTNALGRTVFILLVSVCTSGCGKSDVPNQKPPRVTVKPVEARTVTVAHRYPCQLRAGRFVEVRAPNSGIVGSISVKSGQSVNQDDVLLELGTGGNAAEPGTKTNLVLAVLKAPFTGIVGPLPQSGSFIKQGEVVTSVLDDSAVRAYFNVPEALYLKYKAADFDEGNADLKIELQLTDRIKFDHPGKLVSIGNEFNSETGTVAFRADFPNPDRLLRHGKSSVLILSQPQKQAIVVPHAATFEDDQKRYVYIVDSDDIAHQREIAVEQELDDLFIVKSGVNVDDAIIVEGVLLVRDGDKVEYHGDQKNAVAAVKARRE